MQDDDEPICWGVGGVGRVFPGRAEGVCVSTAAKEDACDGVIGDI